MSNSYVFNPFTEELDIVSTGTGVDQLIWGEIPSGLINGLNKTYTLAYNVSANDLQVMRNGVILEINAIALEINEFDHVSGSNTIILGKALNINDSLRINYRKA